MKIWPFLLLSVAGAAHAQAPVVLRGLPSSPSSGPTPRVIIVTTESQANDALQKGDFGGAADIYARLALDSPTAKERARFSNRATRLRVAGRADALAKRAYPLQGAGRWSEAAALWQKILAIPNFAWDKNARLGYSDPVAMVAQRRAAARWNLGRCFFGQKNYAAALREFQIQEPQPTVQMFFCGNAGIAQYYRQQMWHCACLEGMGRRREAVENYVQLSLDNPFVMDETPARRLVLLYRNAGQTGTLRRWMTVVKAQKAAQWRKKGFKWSADENPTTVLRRALASKPVEIEPSEQIPFPPDSHQPLPTLQELTAISAKLFA